MYEGCTEYANSLPFSLLQYVYIQMFLFCKAYSFLSAKRKNLRSASLHSLSVLLLRLTWDDNHKCYMLRKCKYLLQSWNGLGWNVMLPNVSITPNLLSIRVLRRRNSQVT